MSAFSKLEGLIDSLLGITRANTPTGVLFRSTATPAVLSDYPCKGVILLPYNSGSASTPTWALGIVSVPGPYSANNSITTGMYPITIPCTNTNQLQLISGSLSYIILT